jgi:hypothetical protein
MVMGPLLRTFALVVLPALAAAATPPPVRVHLDQDGPGVSQSKPGQRLVALFRQELEKSRLVTLVDSAEEAEVRLEIREAEVFYEPKAGRVTAKKGGFRSPTSGKKQFQFVADEEVGAEVDASAEAVLVVRLTSGETFVDFTNQAAERTPKAAARTVRDDVEGWLRRRPARAPKP